MTCSQAILHDIAEDMLLHGHIQEQPPASDLELHGYSGQTNFSDSLMVAPYRNRGSIDFVRLRSYFNALCSSAKDHLLALREDPSYFADVFRDIADHSPKMILNSRNWVYPALDTTEFLMVKAREVVIEAYTMFSVWKEIYEIVDQLVEASQEISHDRFSRLMCEFHRRIRKVSVLLSNMLHRYHLTSPNIRKFYVRDDDSLANIKIKLRPGEMCTTGEYQLVVSFQRLYQKTEDPLEDQALYHLLDHMATVMRNSKAAKDLMLPRLSELFGQLSIIGECIMHYSVWYETPQGYAIDKTVSHSHNEEFLKWLYQLDHCQLPVHSINPFRGKLAYPAHKVRNGTNVKIMRTAEANLDKFWDYVDRFYERTTGISQHSIIEECISEGCRMQRTPPWNEPLTTTPKPPEQQEYVHQPFSRIFHDASLQATGAFNKLVIQEKTKHKTSIPPQTFTLDRRAYKTMKTLFHNSYSDTGDFPKAIKWAEFKRAMVRKVLPSRSCRVQRGSSHRVMASMSTVVSTSTSRILTAIFRTLWQGGLGEGWSAYIDGMPTPLG